MTWETAKKDRAFEATGTLDVKWVEDKVRRIVANTHPKQRDFVLDPHRRVSALVGRRGGKTTGQRARFVIKMLRIPQARCVYIATTRVAAEQLMWNPLKDLLGRLGIEAFFSETKLECTFKRNGSTLRLVGAADTSDVDKLRGLKFHEVAIDEAASFPAARLENLIDRVIGPALGDYRGTLSMFGTPGHILAGPFYDATRPSSDRHRKYEDRDLPEYANWTSWSSHAWTLEDGAPHVVAMKNAWDEALQEKADKGWSDDHPIWMREWRGQWAADSTENVFKYRPHVEGVEWNQWDPFGEHKLEGVPALQHAIAKLPADVGWHYVVAQDMGHADPYACNVFAFAPADETKTIWHVYGVERTKMYAKLIAELLLGVELRHEKMTGLLSVTGWPDGMVMDADLAVLDELQSVYGLRILKAERKKDYKIGAIELVNGDMIEGRIKIIKGSVLADQLAQLQWRTDEFGQVSENKAQANHCLAGDTMVQTEHGERRIDAIAVGDMVWTRGGLRRVTFSGQTGHEQTVSFRLPNGRTLTGTSDHRVLTADGWIPLSLLTHYDTYVQWESTDRASVSVSTARNTGGILMDQTNPCGGTSPRQMESSFIALSGQHRMDLFQMGCMSIISTATIRTTTSRTSRRLTADCISASTEDSRSASRCPEQTCSNSRTLPPRNGTAARPESNGIEAMPLSRSIRFEHTRAISAARNFKPSRPEQNDAAQTANASPTTSGCGTSMPVFDLSVEGEHEFYANGVLVSNSTDTLIYGRLLIAQLFEQGGLSSDASKRRTREEDIEDPVETNEEDEFDGLLADGGFDDD